LSLRDAEGRAGMSGIVKGFRTPASVQPLAQ
jgi:hypothetical protein